jgi:hypothetical protein
MSNKKVEEDLSCQKMLQLLAMIMLNLTEKILQRQLMKEHLIHKIVKFMKEVFKISIFHDNIKNILLYHQNL